MHDESSLFPYQRKAINHQCTHPQSMLWLDMGLGKTTITLSSIKYLLGVRYLKAVIIVAPIRVCRLVWRQEAKKWSHLQDLTFSMIVGTRDQRSRALMQKADIYLVNYENLGWLAEALQTYYISKKLPLPFDGVVYDEVTKTKNSTTKRVKALEKVIPHFNWTTGLTGTPASNGYKDLHGQYLVVDGGLRLGTSKSAFKSRFYKKSGFKEIAYDNAEEQIKTLIGDITMEMSAADYNPLPDMIINEVEVEMDPTTRAQYERLETEYFTKLDNGTEVEVFNAASLTNKCLQFSNGAVYPVPGMPLWEPVHDLKLDALEEIIDEAQGQPILCSYAYVSDAERIMARFHDLKPINLTNCKSEKALNDAMTRWKTGDCALMIGHPACLGADTQVLTERNGWVRIVDVESTDRVFDGVEFVSHSGCSYSGHKWVIDVFGMTMTPNHKLLIPFSGEWIEAQDVEDFTNGRSENLRLGLQGEDDGIGGMSFLRGDFHHAPTECFKAQSGGSSALSAMHQDHLSQHDEHPHLENLARNVVEVEEHTGQKLRWSWNHCLSRVGELLNLLRGYVTNLFGQSDHRTGGCESTLLESELCVGDQHGATSQQANQSDSGVSGRNDSPCRTGQTVGHQQDHAIGAAEQGNDSGSSRGGREELSLWEKPTPCERSSPRKAPVYDLVDCGPRHQFVIRNDKGEVFISHNSMGHGIDGLQQNGHILVWFGLNWSLDLVDQFNARIRRQGQGAPVICHRILCKDTLDQAQALALDAKADTQTSLRKAIKEYRIQKEKLASLNQTILY